jgi:hypothetical protein
VTDFEIDARLRAKRLVPHVPPDVQTHAEGEEVALAREEQRSSSVPARMESGEHYSDVVINKRIVGETQHGDTAARA